MSCNPKNKAGNRVKASSQPRVQQKQQKALGGGRTQGRNDPVAAKKASVQAAISSLRDRQMNTGQLEALAMNMVDPQNTQPLVFPSPVPGRCGTAHFPLVVEVTPDAPEKTSLGIIARPSLERPLEISYQGVGFALASGLVNGHAITKHSDGNMDQSSDAYDDMSTCDLETEGFGDPVRWGFPLTTTANQAFTLVVNNVVVVKPHHATIAISCYGYDGVTWNLIHTFTNLSEASDNGTQAALTYTSAYTHFSFSAVENVSGAPVRSTFDFSLRNNGSGWTCVPSGGYDENVMAPYAPNWAGLLANSAEQRVVAAACLVTYTGSTLNNSGVIAACNSDDHLGMVRSYYDTCTSQPYDTYDGRLASVGGSAGGAHWHYVPDDPRDLIIHSNEPVEGQSMVGYFGIKGMAQGETVRVRLDLVVNFFSSDPSYKMVYQPAYTGFSELVRLLRQEVPLVTSNDDHVRKALKVARAVAKKAARGVVDNHESIIPILTMMAQML